MTVQTSGTLIVPNPALHKEFEKLSGVNVSVCYQCEKCTNGCPVAFAMDVLPHRVMRLLHLGQLDKVLYSDTIWVCASCETCSTRCPNGIDIGHIMDKLRQISRSNKGGRVSPADARLFHDEFLASVKQYGRVYELGMIARYTLKTKGLFGYLKQTSVGLTLFLKGKLKLLPHSLRSNKQVRDIFKQAEERAE